MTVRAGECAVCGKAFEYDGRGSLPATCGASSCSTEHRRRLGRIRLQRWARRQVAKVLMEGRTE